MTTRPQHESPQLPAGFVQLHRYWLRYRDLYKGTLVSRQTARFVLDNLSVTFVEERHQLLDISLFRDAAVVDYHGKTWK